MRISVLLLLTFWVTSAPVRLIIDASRDNPPNLSEISDRCITINLKISNFNPLGIEKVYYIKNDVYILQRYQEDGNHYSHVFICDTLGNLKRELIARDPISKATINIIDMQYDMINQRIYLSYSDGYRAFDSNGKLILQIAKTENKFDFYSFIHNDQFWSVEHSSKNGKANYSLIHTDLRGGHKDTVFSKNIDLPSSSNGVGIFAMPSFSINTNKLFVSLGIDNTIYKVDKDVITPSYKIEFKNSAPTSFELFGAPKQIILGHYIKYGYRLKMVSYDFLYGTKNGKSYNIKYLRKNNECILGIKDDVFNTGFFELNPTNDENYVFFFKNAYKANKNLSAPTIFLVKLK